MIFYKKFNNTLLRMNIFHKGNNIFHKSFKIGILVKGIDGVLEIMGGILLVFLNPSRLNKLVVLLTQHELLEDPKALNKLIKKEKNNENKRLNRIFNKIFNK